MQEYGDTHPPSPSLKQTWQQVVGQVKLAMPGFVQQLLLHWARDGRIAQRLMLETWGGLQRTGWMNLLITVTLASILTMFGCITLMVLNAQFYMDNLGSSMEISVYLKDNVNATEVKDDVEGLPQVETVRLISKQEAWASMKASYPEFPNVENPLPDTLRVEVSSPAAIEPTLQKIKTMEEVEKVNYPFKVLKQIKTIAQAVSVFGGVFTLFLGVLTLFIISNTLALLIQARGREIEILRMMGVGNWYIRLPFLLQGAVYGLLGAAVAFVPVSALQGSIGQAFNFFEFSPNAQHLSFVWGLMMMLGTLVGGGGAYLAMRKYLKI